MSTVSAVICEFNPLHSGHQYILNKAKEMSDAVVCVMSGNFVQRGECAVYDKYTRAEAAVRSGADLVLELPFPWCAAPAEFFASAGMSVAVCAGAERIVFGSECGDVKMLSEAASLCRSERFTELTDELYKEENGYAAVRAHACSILAPHLSKIFSSPNDMLSLEYFPSAEKLGFKGEMCAVKRYESEGYLSASEIRKMMPISKESAESVFTDDTAEVFMSANSADIGRLFDLEYILFRLGANSNKSFDSDCGILSRIACAASSASCGKDMFAKASTKKYTDARIRRAALFSCLGITEDDLKAKPRYTVLLGADLKGREILNNMKNINVVTKPSAIKNDAQYEIMKNADALYTMCFESPLDKSFFLRKSPFIR